MGNKKSTFVKLTETEKEDKLKERYKKYKISILGEQAERKIKKQTNFKQKVKELVGNEYSVLEEFTHSNNKILIRHNVCGNEYRVLPYNLLKGCKCPNCNSNSKKTDKQFKQEVYTLTKDEYIALGKYVDAKTKILFKHAKCGYEYNVSPNHFCTGSRCPQCVAEEIKQFNITINGELKEKYKDMFEILTPYTNNKTKMLIKCLTCDNKYYVQPQTLRRKAHECMECKQIEIHSRIKILKYKKYKKYKPRIFRNTKYLKNEINELTHGEYELVGKYENTLVPITIKCIKCGNVWDTRVHDFITKGCRCPQCYIIDKCKELNITIEEWGKGNGQHRRLGNWSIKVRKRDKNKCVICGSKKSLNAHHLNGWKWDIGNRKNVDNGVSLCEECHHKFHDIYGSMNNTKKQFEEYEKPKQLTLTL